MRERYKHGPEDAGGIFSFELSELFGSSESSAFMLSKTNDLIVTENCLLAVNKKADHVGGEGLLS